MSQSAIEGDSCELIVSRSMIRDNLDVGINMVNTARAATITNNFVYRNGNAGSAAGGMFLLLANGSVLEFNTIASNSGVTNDGNLAGGVVCNPPNTPSAAMNYNAPHNLIYRNTGGLGYYQVNGTCTFMASYVMAAGTAAENAVGFVDPNAISPNFHLSVQSPIGTIRDGFDCTGVDFDGDPRPEILGGKCDFGADEYRSGQ